MGGLLNRGRFGTFAKRLFDGTCDIYEYIYIKDEETGVLNKDLVLTLSGEPCRLAYLGSPAAGEGAAAAIRQRVRLFLSPNLEVKAGSFVRVAQSGRAREFILAGEPEIYGTHQEIELISRRREA